MEGYDQPDKLDPNKITDQLQLPNVSRTTNPEILDKIGVEDAEIYQDNADK